MAPARPAVVRFAEKTRLLENGCLEWTAHLNNGGYGVLNVGGKSTLAHRFAWAEAGRVVPDGLQIDHLCRNRACVNVDHMEVVTRSENVRRGLSPIQLRARAAAITHCPRGHAYDEENTRFNKPNNSRDCRACDRERWAERKALRLPQEEWTR